MENYGNLSTTLNGKTENVEKNIYICFYFSLTYHTLLIIDYILKNRTFNFTITSFVENFGLVFCLNWIVSPIAITITLVRHFLQV